MGVVRTRIQTIADIYRLVWTGVASKRPIEAQYHGRPRLFCPHRLGRNREQQLRVLCYQDGDESESGLEPEGYRLTGAIALEKLGKVRLRAMYGVQHQTTPGLHPA